MMPGQPVDKPVDNSELRRGVGVRIIRSVSNPAGKQKGTIMQKHERYAMWQAWGLTASECLADTGLAPTMPDDIRESFRQSLFDIGLRDAILAQSALKPEFRPALKQIFAVLAEDDNVPARTLLACMEYLDNDTEAADVLVSGVLETEQYSLARLIKNGLEMRAPASMLARSFSHYSPEELLNS